MSNTDQDPPTDQDPTEQAGARDAPDAPARSGTDRSDGVPEVVEPAPRPASTLAGMTAAWRSIDPGADAVTAFAAAWTNRPGASDLLLFTHTLLNLGTRTAEQESLLVEVLHRALESPTCPAPDTHWRPHLVEAMLRAGDLAAAGEQIARVVTGLNGFEAAGWTSVIGYLDALGRRKDAAAVHRLACRYVSGFADDHRRTAWVTRAEARASQVLLELAGPVLADPDQLGEAALDHAAYLFGDLHGKRLVDQQVAEAGHRLRASLDAWRRRTLRDGLDRLAGGEPCDGDRAAELLTIAAGAPTLVTEAEADRLARVAVRDGQGAAVALFGRRAHVENPSAALTALGVLLAAAPPAGGDARSSWLWAANEALIISHGAGRFADSARLADQVVGYARENPYLTHSAACSYVAAGRLDDAMAQVRLAVELGYERLDRLRADTDLDPIRERPDFVALLG